DDLTGFRLYRRPMAGVFAQIAELQRGLADQATILSFFAEPGEDARAADIEEWAFNSSGGAVVGITETVAYLHDILSVTPGHPNYNPMNVVFLSRMNPNVARALGLAYIDRNALPPGSYEYMLTGLMGTTETLPLGKTVVDSSVEDVLPAPGGFSQVFVGGCSVIGRGLDDRRIHFRWDVPLEPERLRQRILTYGYDLFRSDAPLALGPNDLRNMQMSGMFNPALTKVNRVPIVVAGQPAAEGRESYLAIDQGDYNNFNYLQRGRTYSYYLVARDLTGKYSEMAPALTAMVPDANPPPAPWGVRSEEVKDPMTPTIPRLQIVWDEMDKPNFLKNYGTRRHFVNPPAYANPLELHYVPDGEQIEPKNLREVDLDVDRYLLFRFFTQEDAQGWGVDSDVDYWPDEIEDASGTDKCDPMSHPAGNPPELAAIIPTSDATTLRTLRNGMKQRFFRDTVPIDDNHVYWYRLIAVDPFDNQSPLSPPVRGVLWDRDQPDPDAEITKERCRYTVERDPNCFFTAGGIRIKASDESAARENPEEGRARSVCLYEVCVERDPLGNPIGETLVFILEKEIRQRMAIILIDDLTRIMDCRSLCGDRREDRSAIFVLRYYDARGHILASSEYFSGLICQTQGPDCFILKEDCREVPVDPGETLDPGDDIHICVELKAGERARIFHELNGKMTPFKTIHAASDVALMDYCEDIDLTAIVPAGACLGVRVFSKNNVGSFIKYLNCVTIPSGTPEAPLMHSVDPAGTNLAPKFTVRWAAQSEGLSAFVLAMRHQKDVRFETYWIDDSNGAISYLNGLYEVMVDLNPATDLYKEWCFEVRAVDKTLRSSPWSEEMCETWEPEPGDHLTWPPVPETPAGSGILAYFLATPLMPQVVLVLSEDLTGKINLDNRCNVQFPDCRETQGEGCLRPFTFFCTGICDELKAANQYGKFIVFRQEEGKDFVQVSPLIDTFWCYREETKPAGGGLISQEILDDPFVFLAAPNPSFIFPVPIRPEVSGLRLLFADNYPCRRGSKVRYQVMVVDPITGEGTAMHTSNWLDIP
ncbi:MAG: hypothetical protein HUU16_07900, partial [Candidatus Omnitrophica bacterium]|nr:hypothetical protein [Candidatus Omnitrophota bacterium]